MASAVVMSSAQASSGNVTKSKQTKQRSDNDPFRQGDLVVYPAHGVGTIDRIGNEVIGGMQLELIQISFAENRMTLRVPVAKARAAGLRRLAPREACEEALTVLAGRPRVSRLMWAKRAQEYQAKINSGDPKALAEVMRDLRPNPDGSSSTSQRNLFEAAEDRLATELAAVWNVDKPTAIERMNEAARKGRAGRDAKAADDAEAAAA